MSPSIARLKPAASQGVQALLAACAWTIVGLALAGLGLRWSLTADDPASMSLMLIAIAVGAAKAILILRPAARRVLNRLILRGDDTCLGGFFSWRTWLLVAAMMVAGRLLRLSSMPEQYTGVIYLAIGTGLLLASLYLWAGWRRVARDRGPVSK
jgi:hypothetical protein